VLKTIRRYAAAFARLRKPAPMLLNRIDYTGRVGVKT
jgi:hypothetical protein